MELPDGIEVEVSACRGISEMIVSISMKQFCERKFLWCLPVLLLLSGCGRTEPACDSLDTRNSVLKILSDDSNNALVNYAAKNSSAVEAKENNAKTEAKKSEIKEKASQGASYRMDDQVNTNSKSNDKRTLTCSGTVYAVVGDTTAQKTVDFKVEQAPDGTVSVSVSPFKF